MKKRSSKVVDKINKKSERLALISYFLFFLKLLLAILIAITIPFLFLIVFLMKEPQEIEVVNKYIDQKIIENNLISRYKYDNAKIGIDKKLRLDFNMYNVELIYDDNFVIFPEISFKFNILDLLRKNFTISKIKVSKFIIYLGYSPSDDKKSSNLVVNDVGELQFKIYELIRYIHRGNDIINSLSITDSSLYIFDKNSNSANKIDIVDSKIKLFGKLGEIVNIDTKIKIKINNSNDFVNTVINCSIKNNDDINCSFNLNNFKVNSIDFVGLLKPKDNELQESLNSVDGLFNFESDLTFSNYINFNGATFKLYSSAGSFFIKQLFGDKVTYKNLMVDGTVEGLEHIELKTVKTNFVSKEMMDFKLSLDYHKNQDMKIDIDIANAFVNDIRIFWPVFLDDNGIREWVVEHIKDGSISNAFAYMNFEFTDDTFVLNSIKSEVSFYDTTIDYHKSFPVITNVDAKAIFSVNDMNIYVEKAKLADTTLTDAKIYLDFQDKMSTLNITTSAMGKAYELFYFVNNSDREKVKDLVTRYIDGYAYTKANVKIPIASVSLENTFIKVDSHIKNNNSFVFKDNSELKINLLKAIGSNTFNVRADCGDAFINFPTLGFVKNKGEDLKILLDVIIQNNRTLLTNIRPLAKNKIDFIGNGNIELGVLNELNFDYVTYGDTKFNVLYTDKPNENPDIFVNIENLNFKKDFNREELLKLLGNNDNGDNKDSNKHELSADIKFQIANLTLNDKYNLTNTFISVSLEKGEVKQFELRDKSNSSSELFVNIINTAEDNTKYKVELECSNLGTFLSNSSITDNLVYGKFYFSGVVDDKSGFSGKFLLDNDFHIITKNVKDAEFFNYILNNENVSEKIKNDLKNQNMMSFKRLSGDVEFYDNILTLKDIMASSSDMFGVGISGSGFMNIESGMIRLEGFIAPIEKLNKLFGINKIPIINQILFGGEDKGLITIDYNITKKDYDSSFELSITKANGINNITPIDSLLKFLSIQK